MPDGDSGVAIEVADKRLVVPEVSWPCPEALWSPDSKAFFLSYSTGGLVGTFELRIYGVTPQALTVTDPTRQVRRDFLSDYPRCFQPEHPNVVGVAWLTPSQLLVAAEVLPHSNCDSMGTFATYVVDSRSGRILRKHGQLESKQRFSQLLGAELLNANDACIRRPESCWVPALRGR